MKIPKRDVLSMYVDCIAQGERTIISHGFVDRVEVVKWLAVKKEIVMKELVKIEKIVML